MRFARLVFVFAIVLALASAAHAGKQFRWKLQQGEKFTGEMTQKTTSKTTIKGQTVEAPVDMSMKYSWQVDAAEADKFTVGQTLDRVVMTSRTPQGEVTFDSASTDPAQGLAAQFERMLRPMVGAKFVEVKNARGKVLEFTVPQEAVKGLDSPLAKQVMSAETLKENAKRFQPEFPEAEIEKGHSWTSEGQLKMPLGALKLTTTYTYEGENAERKLDQFKVELNMELAAGGILGGAMKITEQKSQGALYFDHAAGRVVESTMKQELTLESKLFNETIKNQTATISTFRITPVK